MLLLIAVATAVIDRRALLGRAVSLGAVAVPPRCAVAAAADGSREELLSELRTLLGTPAPPPIAGGDSRAPRIDAVLDALRERNPTARPGSAASYAPLAPGTWRVAFAPHIAKLSSAAGARFDPILYTLRADGGITSHVRYSWLGVADGWLSTVGEYGSRDELTSYVEWDDAWWEPGAASPGDDPRQGAFAPFVSALGKAGFVTSFSNFPVEYLDRDLCVFVFPLSGTRIAAVRTGGGLDVWGGGGKG